MANLWNGPALKKAEAAKKKAWTNFLNRFAQSGQKPVRFTRKRRREK